jgi:hypothetical protein
MHPVPPPLPPRAAPPAGGDGRARQRGRRVQRDHGLRAPRLPRDRAGACLGRQPEGCAGLAVPPSPCRVAERSRPAATWCWRRLHAHPPLRIALPPPPPVCRTARCLSSSPSGRWCCATKRRPWLPPRSRCAPRPGAPLPACTRARGRPPATPSPNPYPHPPHPHPDPRRPQDRKRAEAELAALKTNFNKVRASLLLTQLQQRAQAARTAATPAASGDGSSPASAGTPARTSSGGSGGSEPAEALGADALPFAPVAPLP